MLDNFKDVSENLQKRFADCALGKRAENMSVIFQNPDNPREYYNSYEKRVNFTPREDSVNGMWEGQRGESKFKPSPDTEDGRVALEKLKEKGLDGINYKNAEPDFSECSEICIFILGMTENRDDYYDENGRFVEGNFSQADVVCANEWNVAAKDGKIDWTARDVYNWRHENKYSWHERCDCKSMDLVPREIHSCCKHLGGVSECRVRDSICEGDEFDE